MNKLLSGSSLPAEESKQNCAIFSMWKPMIRYPTLGHEPGLPEDMELEADHSQEGVVSVCFTRDIQPVKYEFTEI